MRIGVFARDLLDASAVCDFGKRRLLGREDALPAVMFRGCRNSAACPGELLRRYRLRFSLRLAAGQDRITLRQAQGAVPGGSEIASARLAGLIQWLFC
jgi:hypothetical protein